MKIVGNKLYDVCENCGKIVCLNKRIFGGLHFCTLDEEQKQYAPYIKAKYEMNKKLLENAK